MLIRVINNYCYVMLGHNYSLTAGIGNENVFKGGKYLPFLNLVYKKIVTIYVMFF